MSTSRLDVLFLNSSYSHFSLILRSSIPEMNSLESFGNHQMEAKQKDRKGQKASNWTVTKL